MVVHVWESFISQLHNSAQYESTSFRLSNQNKDLKILNKFEKKFTEREKERHS